MKTFTYVITEEQGIHARPAGALVKEAKKYRSHITLKNGDKAADATRLLAIMGMNWRYPYEPREIYPRGNGTTRSEPIYR